MCGQWIAHDSNSKYIHTNIQTYIYTYIHMYIQDHPTSASFSLIYIPVIWVQNTCLILKVGQFRRVNSNSTQLSITEEICTYLEREPNHSPIRIFHERIPRSVITSPRINYQPKALYQPEYVPTYIKLFTRVVHIDNSHISARNV